jgi:hypothetical protein
LECKGMWDYLGEVGDHRKQVWHVKWKSGSMEGGAGGGNVEHFAYVEERVG